MMNTVSFYVYAASCRVVDLMMRFFDNAQQIKSGSSTGRLTLPSLLFPQMETLLPVGKIMPRLARFHTVRHHFHCASACVQAHVRVFACVYTDAHVHAYSGVNIGRELQAKAYFFYSHHPSAGFTIGYHGLGTFAYRRRSGQYHLWFRFPCLLISICCHAKPFSSRTRLRLTLKCFLKWQLQRTNYRGFLHWNRYRYKCRYGKEIRFEHSKCAFVCVCVDVRVHVRVRA